MERSQPAGQAPGQPVPRLFDGDAPGPESSPPVLPMRLVLDPGGLSVELNKPSVLIGRHSESDVRMALPDISRRHCRFVFARGGWRVYDLHSLNGTWVNEERVEEAALKPGDRVRIGSLTFQVKIEAPAPEGQTHEGVLKGIADELSEQDEQRRKAS